MRKGIIFSVLISIFNVLSAQTNSAQLNWEEVYNDGQTTVHTSFSKVKTSEGTEEVVFNWQLRSVQEANFQKCVETLKNIELHKKIYDCKSSELVSQTDTSKVVYYIFNAPWPMPDMDLVRTISGYLENDTQTYISRHDSTPQVYNEKGKKRLQVSDIHYKLEKLSKKETRIELQGKFIPIGAPVILSKTWFPKGPVKIVERIIEISN